MAPRLSSLTLNPLLVIPGPCRVSLSIRVTLPVTFTTRIDTQLQPAGGQTVTFSNICVAFIVPSVAPGNGYSVMCRSSYLVSAIGRRLTGEKVEAILSNGNPRFGYSASFSVQSD